MLTWRQWRHRIAHWFGCYLIQAVGETSDGEVVYHCTTCGRQHTGLPVFPL